MPETPKYPKEGVGFRFPAATPRWFEVPNRHNDMLVRWIGLGDSSWASIGRPCWRAWCLDDRRTKRATPDPSVASVP